MARNVFISFRYSDGKQYKKELSDLFQESDDTVDFSEDIDHSDTSDETIKEYLYRKLAKSSVTIILLTPQAINHEKNKYGEYDDWMYDEIRYSLEDRENNRTNGIVAVYVPESKKYLISEQQHKCHNCSGYATSCIADVDNLFRKNMMNIKSEYKNNHCDGVFDSKWDSYCSLVSFDSFKENFAEEIERSEKKRDEKYKYDVHARLQ